jgi:hypothetical protein
MKVITLNKNNRALIIAEDDDILSIESNHVLHNEEKTYGIYEGIVTLHENVENVPEDLNTQRYTFDGTDWTPFNPA